MIKSLKNHKNHVKKANAFAECSVGTFMHWEL